MKTNINSSGNIDLIGGSIPQVDIDLDSNAEESWVLKGIDYQFSYKTKEGTTKRLTLS